MRVIAILIVMSVAGCTGFEFELQVSPATDGWSPRIDGQPMPTHGDRYSFSRTYDSYDDSVTDTFVLTIATDAGATLYEMEHAPGACGLDEGNWDTERLFVSVTEPVTAGSYVVVLSGYECQDGSRHVTGVY